MSRLDWPAGWSRTDASERSPNNSFEVTLSKAFSDLETELDRLGVGDEDFRYSFDAQQRKKDQRPYRRSNPDDPGFVLRWTMDGHDHAVACDQYSRLRDNVRAVGLYLHEKRKMDSRPVQTGQSEFANARLPSGDDPDAVVAQEPPHAILGVDRDADQAEIRQAFRQRVQTVHPDHGGSEEEFRRVKDAKEAMLGE